MGDQPCGLGPEDLVLCSATLGRQLPWIDKLSAAAEAGFDAVSLYVWEYQAALAAGSSAADLRAMLAHYGLRVAEVDGAMQWLPAHHEPRVGAPPLFGLELFLEAASAVGARSLTVHDTWGIRILPADEQTAADAFGVVCDAAAAQGLLAHIEFFPWSGIDNMRTAWHIVRQADRPNGGIILDTWHLFRGPDAGTIPSDVPASAILGIQLNDAPRSSSLPVQEECVHHRLLPGDGAIGVSDVLRTLWERGCTAPVGTEVFSDDLNGLPPTEAAMRAGDATRRVMTSARCGTVS
jgi:sugar phosphate isomerase/epimerase